MPLDYLTCVSFGWVEAEHFSIGRLITCPAPLSLWELVQHWSAMNAGTGWPEAHQPVGAFVSRGWDEACVRHVCRSLGNGTVESRHIPRRRLHRNRVWFQNCNMLFEITHGDNIMSAYLIQCKKAKVPWHRVLLVAFRLTYSILT